MGDCYDINMPVNFKGDTLLHYACAVADRDLVQFLLKQPTIIRTRRNNFDMTAEDVIKKNPTTDVETKDIRKIR